MNLPTPGYGNVEVNNSGASNSGNTSGGLGDLANQIQQGRDDMGYSGGGNGGSLSDEAYDWISGNVQLD